MKLFAPKYYKDFVCIADKCEHSCCIGWEIDIDKKTHDKYKKLKNGYSENIINSISLETVPHFKLCKNERCPHLDENNLCKIILNLGEDYLCDICREHPRFYNYTTIAEVGIGMSCREAARVIFSSSDYNEFEEIGRIETDDETIDFDALDQRKKLYEILSDKELEYNKRLEKIYSEYNIKIADDEILLEIINSLEYLDETHKELFMNYSSKKRPKDLENYLERALAYFIYRHCTEAFDIEDFCCRLDFCLFCERLLASLIWAENVNDLKQIAVLASIISEEIEYSEDNTQALMY